MWWGEGKGGSGDTTCNTSPKKHNINVLWGYYVSKCTCPLPPQIIISGWNPGHAACHNYVWLFYICCKSLVHYQKKYRGTSWHKSFFTNFVWCVYTGRFMHFLLILRVLFSLMKGITSLIFLEFTSLKIHPMRDSWDKWHKSVPWVTHDVNPGIYVWQISLNNTF